MNKSANPIVHEIDVFLSPCACVCKGCLWSMQSMSESLSVLGMVLSMGLVRLYLHSPPRRRRTRAVAAVGEVGVAREVAKAAEAAVAARVAIEAPATKRGGVREGERHTRGLFVTAV